MVTNLRLALSWSRFADAMGPALKSKEGEKLRYDLERLPKEWTRHSQRLPEKITVAVPAESEMEGSK